MSSKTSLKYLTSSTDNTNTGTVKAEIMLPKKNMFKMLLAKLINKQRVLPSATIRNLPQEKAVLNGYNELQRTPKIIEDPKKPPYSIKTVTKLPQEKAVLNGYNELQRTPKIIEDPLHLPGSVPPTKGGKKSKKVSKKNNSSKVSHTKAHKKK